MIRGFRRANPPRWCKSCGRTELLFWWLLGKDEGHGFAKKKNRDYQFYATIMFVKEFLLK